MCKTLGLEYSFPQNSLQEDFTSGHFVASYMRKISLSAPHFFELHTLPRRLQYIKALVCRHPLGSHSLTHHPTNNSIHMQRIGFMTNEIKRPAGRLWRRSRQPSYEASSSNERRLLGGSEVRETSARNLPTVQGRANLETTTKDVEGPPPPERAQISPNDSRPGTPSQTFSYAAPVFTASRQQNAGLNLEVMARFSLTIKPPNFEPDGVTAVPAPFSDASFLSAPTARLFNLEGTFVPYECLHSYLTPIGMVMPMRYTQVKVTSRVLDVPEMELILFILEDGLLPENCQDIAMFVGKAFFSRLYRLRASRNSLPGGGPWGLAAPMMSEGAARNQYRPDSAGCPHNPEGITGSQLTLQLQPASSA